MKLLLPSIYAPLHSHIEDVLQLASKVGFAVESIELSISDQCEVVTIVNGNEVITISSDSHSNEHFANCDFRVRYSHGLDETQLSSNLASLEFGDVYIDVTSANNYADVWSCREGTIKASADANKVIDKDIHFAWFVVCLALDFPLEDTMMLARAGSVSRETWPAQLEQFSVPVIENHHLGIRVGWAVDASNQAFPKVSKQKLGLYPVVDSIEWIERLLKLGVKTIQLRIKQPDTPNLEQQIEQAIRLGEKHDAQVFINDYWQLALKHGAYGVHLGQEDIEVADLKQLAEQGIALGLSTHGYYELLRIIQINPSYIALGHIFPTTTKQMPSKPQGLVRLALYQKLIDSIPYGDAIGYPTVAIGGIDLKTAKPVWDCGVTSLAVVRAITLSDNVPAVLDNFATIMSERTHD
ncbi:thiamine phosphate synthase [Vibrio maritimus]|uniref:thiamine phosphate synthase n=1 Tax=Vibrio maritimus TaxID=990268 RepID=UPI003736735D